MKMVNMSTPRLTSFSRVSTPAMMPASGVDTTPEVVEQSDATIWSKSKDFVVNNKEIIAVGVVVGAGAAYLYHRKKQQEQLAEQVKNVFTNFEKELEEAVKPTVTTTVSAV